jgi:hypothetical protein
MIEAPVYSKAGDTPAGVGVFSPTGTTKLVPKRVVS